MLEASGTSIVYDLNFEPEMRELRAQIARWIDQSDAEMHEALKWQFVAGSKYFRPLTIFSCFRAMHQGELPAQIIRGALLIELFHNVSLVIDDIVDQSEYRREQLTLHTKFGQLTALMTSGYIVADGYRVAGDDLQASNLLSELLKRLAVAECMQWRLRRQPLGVEDWQDRRRGHRLHVRGCRLPGRSQRAPAQVRRSPRPALSRLRRCRRRSRHHRARRRRLR